MSSVIVEPTIQKAYLCEECSRLYDDKRGTERFTPEYEGVGVKPEMIVCKDCSESKPEFISPTPNVITSRERRHRIQQ